MGVRPWFWLIWIVLDLLALCFAGFGFGGSLRLLSKIGARNWNGSRICPNAVSSHPVKAKSPSIERGSKEEGTLQENRAIAFQMSLNQPLSLCSCLMRV